MNIYINNKEDALDILRFSDNPSNKEYSRAERHLYLYLKLFLNESKGISNVLSLSKEGSE